MMCGGSSRNFAEEAASGQVGERVKITHPTPELNGFLRFFSKIAEIAEVDADGRQLGIEREALFERRGRRLEPAGQEIGDAQVVVENGGGRIDLGCFDEARPPLLKLALLDRKSTRLNSSHSQI